jgi:hypothetical protein
MEKNISINSLYVMLNFDLLFGFDSYTFIFLLFSSDTIQVLMSVCPTDLELRLYVVILVIFHKI